MKTLKYLILMTFLFAGMIAEAKNLKIIYRTEFHDPEMADIAFKVEDGVEPVFQPLLISVAVKCVDNRTHKNSIKPIWEKAISDKSTCQAFEPVYDKKNKTLTIPYKRVSEKPGAAKCNDFRILTFDLKIFCEEWVP